MSLDHGVTPDKPVTAEAAVRVARVMAALGTTSRVRILGHLRQGSYSVGEITEAVEMAQPAVSHQLRILRDLGLVVGIRSGRQIRYGLHDPHVATLIDEALRHVDHLLVGAVAVPEIQATTHPQPTKGAA
jgi:DNA-binding transcriptional ArsR family regulator